jgi:hypothetical protein
MQHCMVSGFYPCTCQDDGTAVLEAAATAASDCRCKQFASTLLYTIQQMLLSDGVTLSGCVYWTY